MPEKPYDGPFKGQNIVDTETTGLDPDRHDIWNLALIDCANGRKYEWLWNVDLKFADPGALRVNHFYQVYEKRRARFTARSVATRVVATVVAGKKLAGMNPAFDARFLENMLRNSGEAAAWDYHLIDVEAAMFGALGQDMWIEEWSSSAMARAIGVAADRYDRHTAMGDAEWAHDCLSMVLGLSVPEETHVEG